MLKTNPLAKDRLLLIVLILVVFFAFSHVLFLGSVWDDNDSVFTNSHVTNFSLSTIPQIFTSKVLSVYVPVTTLTFALEYHFFGKKLYLYHLDNLILHLLIVGLIFYFGRMLGFSSRCAFLSALIFGLHPMHVESVAWISERKDVLYVFFYILTLIAHERFVDSKKTSFLVATYILGVLSMLSKPMALSLPFALLLIDWFKGRKIDRTVFLKDAGHLLYIIPITLITYVGHARNPILDLGQAVLLWMWSLAFYVGKFFWPANLTVLYEPALPVALSNPAYIQSIIILGICAIILVLFRKSKIVLFAFAYYFFSIFFLLRMDLEHDLTFVADRYMYLPSLGFCLLSAFLLEKLWIMLPRLRIVTIGLMAGIFLTFTYLTVVRIESYSDLLTMWKKTLAQNPQLAFGHYSIGNVYKEMKQYDTALKHYNASLQIRPYSTEVYYNRGDCYAKMKMFEPALKDFNRSIELSTKYIDPFFNRGILYLENNMLHLALADFDKTLEISPDYTQAHNNRANANIRLKNYDAAIKDLRAIIVLDRRFFQADYQLAYIYKERMEWEKALIEYDKVLALRPKNTYALNRRGEMHVKLGQDEEALRDFNKAIELFPSFGLAYENRALVYEKLGSLQAAEENHAKAKEFGTEVDYDAINAF